MEWIGALGRTPLKIWAAPPAYPCTPDGQTTPCNRQVLGGRCSGGLRGASWQSGVWWRSEGLGPAASRRGGRRTTAFHRIRKCTSSGYQSLLGCHTYLRVRWHAASPWTEKVWKDRRRRVADIHHREVSRWGWLWRWCRCVPNERRGCRRWGGEDWWWKCWWGRAVDNGELSSVGIVGVVREAFLRAGRR